MFQAVTRVSSMISEVLGGTSTSGTETSGAEFVASVTEFLTVISINSKSVKVTALALAIVSAQVGTVMSPHFLSIIDQICLLSVNILVLLVIIGLLSVYLLPLVGLLCL